MLSISEKLCLFQILILFNIFYSTAGDRKSVVKGKSVKISVDLGGRRIIKKKKKRTRPRPARLRSAGATTPPPTRAINHRPVPVNADVFYFCRTFFFFQAEDGIRDF